MKVNRVRNRTTRDLSNTLEFRSTNPSEPDQSHGPYQTDLDVEDLNDWVVDRYRERIAAGEIINNPCTYVHTSLESSGSGFGRYEKLTGNPYKYYYTLEGPLTYFRSINAPPVGSVEITTQRANEVVAKQQAIANIDSTPYAFAEDALELGETIRFLRKPSTGLLKLAIAFNKAVRRHPKAASDLGKAIADTWLTYRFAISPLVKSSHDLLEQWWSFSKKEEPPRLTARGFSVVEDEGASVLYDASASYKYEAEASVYSKGHAQILYTVTNPIRDTRWRLGVRNKDIPAAIWAVMPYSFMVDRVLDISSMIQGMSNMLDPNVEILSGSYTLREEVKSSLKHVWHAYPGWAIEVTGEKRTETSFQYVRTPWSPSLSDTLPAFTGSELYDSLTKMADLWALIRARVRP